MKRPLRCRVGLVALATASGLLAAACTPASAPVSGSLEESIPGSRSGMMALASASGPSLSSTSAPTTPIASLSEGAGAVATMRAKGYVNGFRQDISLKGSAQRGVQNSITVIARTSKQETLDEAAPLYKPAEAGIRSEIGAQFPKIAMQVSEREFSNNYGPYGLALGRAGGDIRCAYMWQWIDENRLPSSAGVIGPVSIRVRLCQAGTSFDAMRGLFDNLSIGGASNGSQSVATGEQAQVLPLPADETEQTAKPKRHKVAHRRKQVAKADPSPPPAAAPPAQQTIIAAPPVPAGGSSGTAASRPSADLPPEAFLGPKGGARAAAAAPSANATRPN